MMGVFSGTMATILLLLLLLHLSEQARLRTFHLTEESMTQSEARAACRIKYTDLVTVYSDEDNAKLTNKTGSNTAVWIGLYRSPSSVQWSNGDNVTFNDLTVSCASGTCCAAMKADGSWEGLKCTEKRAFMCYKEDACDLTLTYHLVLEILSWSGAQSYCRGRYTDLVSIRDQSQNEGVMTAGKNSSAPFWIGLLKDPWVWADGGRSAYRNWGSSQPQPSPSNCTKLMNGKWFSVPCGNAQPALCYSTLLNASNDRMTWEEALNYCKTRFGPLHIQSESDQKEVENELKRQKIFSGTFWLGLGQSRLFGFWVWTNGMGVGPWTNWVGGTAPRPPLSHHCGAIDADTGFKWRDKNCRTKFRALCQVNKN